MRACSALLLIALAATTLSIQGPIIAEGVTASSAGCASIGDNTLSYVGRDFLLVGGQNGTWFGSGQYPRLSRVYLTNGSSVSIPTFPGEGTIWNGAGNGTSYLVSGWGNDEYGANPPILLYDNQMALVSSSAEPSSNSSWYGGDVFAASYNGKEWLLSGLGSGLLESFNGGRKANHMSLALYDGATFTDLSNLIPLQHWGILYSNEWNGQYWLVGGGYAKVGTLFKFNGTKLEDLTTEIRAAVPTFGAVTKVAWNKNYWLIGGNNFLAKYDGVKFSDLSPALKAVLTTHGIYSVNAIGWNGSAWLLAGGMPKASVQSGTAWIVTLRASVFTNLSNAIPCGVARPHSSILTASYKNSMWVLGGYVGKNPLLLLIKGDRIFDISKLAIGMTYVIWVEIASQQQSQPMWIE